MLVFLYHAVKVGATSKRTPLQPLSQNILSKYLVQFVPETPRPAVKQSANRVFGQRVLTSSQGYKILADKEAKKQEELRDKEQKKAERLENKRRKEIERQRKAEERKAKKSAKSKPKKHSSKTKKNGSSQSGSSSSGDATQESQDTCCECSRTYVLGSEKIRLMERKMKNEILGSVYSPAKTLQNKPFLMKIGQSSQKIQSFKVESQHST